MSGASSPHVGRAGIAVLAAALLLAAWSVIPFAIWWNGTAPGYFANYWLRGWALLLAALITAAVVILSRGRALDAGEWLWAKVARLPDGAFVATAAGLLALLTVAMSVVVFAGNPRNVDGFAQLFHARMFLAGRAWVPPPPAAEVANFATLHMVIGPDRWFSQYPPGQAAVLAAGLALGRWWLLNPLIAATLAWATWSVARWCVGASAARVTLLLLCVSPFVVAVSGSEMSHLAAATCGVLAAAFATSAGGARGGLAAAGAGVALGAMAAFRPLDAVAAAAPVTVILLAVASRRLRALGVTVLSGAAASLPVLLFNQATTGSWRTFGYTYLWGPGHSLGFHAVPWGEPLTPLRAIGRSGMDLHQINAYLFDAPLPVTLLIAAGLLVARRRLTGRLLAPVAGVVGLVAVLFAYWHRDVFYGPRFLFSAVPWVVMLCAYAVIAIGSAGSSGLPRQLARAVALLVVVALAFGLAFVTPRRIRAYMGDAPVFSLHPDRDARRAGIHHAVVVIPDGWGQRLIVRMWSLGVPVPRAGRLYAAIDACTLEHALDDAAGSPQRRARLAPTLDSLAALARPGIRAGLTEDPNLRLPPPETLTPRCRGELDFDRRGFLQFAPFLYLNTAALDGDVVWARDMREGNAALLAHYRDRRAYRYAPPEPGGRPTFTELSDR